MYNHLHFLFIKSFEYSRRIFPILHSFLLFQLLRQLNLVEVSMKIFLQYSADLRYTTNSSSFCERQRFFYLCTDYNWAIFYEHMYQPQNCCFDSSIVTLKYREKSIDSLYVALPVFIISFYKKEKISFNWNDSR